MKFPSFFFLILFVLFSQSSQAQLQKLSASEAAVLKNKVLQTAASTKTITSEFVQKKHLDFLSNDIETFGRMTFKSPDLIRWEYTDPYQYSVIFKEEKLYINDGGDKSKVNLGSNQLFQSLNDLIAKSIKGDMFDEQEFDIAYFSEKGHYVVNFQPKKPELQSFIHTFQLSFDKTSGEVLEVKMIEPSEDYTRIIFKNRQLNAPVNNEVFTNN